MKVEALNSGSQQHLLIEAVAVVAIALLLIFFKPAAFQVFVSIY